MLVKSSPRASADAGRIARSAVPLRTEAAHGRHRDARTDSTIGIRLAEETVTPRQSIQAIRGCTDFARRLRALTLSAGKDGAAVGEEATGDASEEGEAQSNGSAPRHLLGSRLHAE